MGRIEQFLQQRCENNLLRGLRPVSAKKGGRLCIDGANYIDLSSNDYLGLAEHPHLLQAAKKAAEAFGVGASASRLLSGDLEIHHQLEEEVAAFKDKPKALVFNSGYQANLGIISALCSRGDAVFCDRLSHASIIDGAILSRAQLFRFNHNDAGHLQSLLKAQRHKFQQALVVTETIFSMEGDRCPLREISQLKQKYNCRLLVDEAHATGIFGERGSGVVEEEDLGEGVDLIMGTFSKALGSFGAYVAGEKQIIDYLINTARSFIYSTALPASVIAANLASLELINKEPQRRKTLLVNAEYFRRQLISRGFSVKGSSQIVPLILGDDQKAMFLSDQLKDKGYWALPIRTPTVPEGEARVRFSLSYRHDKQMLERLANEISI